MPRCLPALSAVLLCLTASARAADVPTAAREQPALHALAAAPSETELRATIEQAGRLRHPPHAVRHEVGHARHRRRAALGEGALRGDLARLRRLPRGRHAVADVHRQAHAQRRPRSMDVRRDPARHAAIPDRVIVITGHIDSRVTDVMDATTDAPGANDDASGVAALIEAARVLSKQDNSPPPWCSPCCPARSRACTAARCWPTTPRRRAGRSRPTSTTTSSATATARTACATTRTVRVFSEGTKSDRDRRSRRTTAATTAARSIRPRATSPASWTASPTDYLPDLRVQHGLPHRPLRPRRRPGGVPRGRLSRRCASPRRTRTTPASTRTCAPRTASTTATPSTASTSATWPRSRALNAITMAALAAPRRRRPASTSTGAVATDTTVKWTPVPGAAGYRVWWRDTTAPQWQHAVARSATPTRRC